MRMPNKARASCSHAETGGIGQCSMAGTSQCLSSPRTIPQKPRNQNPRCSIRVLSGSHTGFTLRSSTGVKTKCALQAGFRGLGPGFKGLRFQVLRVFELVPPQTDRSKGYQWETHKTRALRTKKPFRTIEDPCKTPYGPPYRARKKTL